MSDKERKDAANKMAFGMDSWDNRPRSLMLELQEFLENMKDAGTSIDTGGGDGTGDLWVTVGGVEYFVSVRLSNAQLIRLPWR